MFSSGNLFRIEFAKLPSLNLKHGGDKGRDFANFSLPFGALTTTSAPSSLSALHHYSYPSPTLEHFDPLGLAGTTDHNLT
jgi:hypothetical protein